MTNRTRRGVHFAAIPGSQEAAKDPEFLRRREIRAAYRALGEVIYFIRCRDGAIKIGWTRNLHQRRRSFTTNPLDLLAVIPGTYAEEQALHARFVKHLRHGREYYEPVAEIIDHINEIRARMNVPVVAA